MCSAANSFGLGECDDKSIPHGGGTTTVSSIAFSTSISRSPGGRHLPIIIGHAEALATTAGC